MAKKAAKGKKTEGKARAKKSRAEPEVSRMRRVRRGAATRRR